MYILSVEDTFSSAHQLRGYKGKCENIHGHNWKVILTVRGDTLNDIGLLIDFHELKAILREITGALDHKNINEVPPFDTINPSSENIAAYIADSAAALLAAANSNVEIDTVTVWESATSRCSFKPQPD